MRLGQMPPGYFAMVMFTSIVSLACHFMGLAFLALVLFWMNVGFTLILWCLSLLRLTFYPCRVLDDLQSHFRGVEFFTVIAGTRILGGKVVINKSQRIQKSQTLRGAGTEDLRSS